ncbi:PIR Superfamily Protein [Plasmodium ovale wallikeri]|uniref:PIR Superfamily Protein n=1 Tax=Plasmodium ovale wallikeri TaxID=864142 RepID=A0A1A9A4I2_PLAOA|nr:PIR Superfamily Protein [Plasmodium ovale wallikeri]
MTNSIHVNDLPSKKYNDELKEQIHYQEIVQNIESETFAPEDKFWSTTLHKYLEEYISKYVDTWSVSNDKKRCRDLNNILDSIIKKIKNKKTYDESYNLTIGYINNSATSHLRVNTHECIRESKLTTHYNDIEYMKKIDDLCEDIDYIKNRISEINSVKCEEIKNYIEQQITELENIYRTSDNKYSDILEYYGFKSFDDFDDISENIKSKCKEGTEASTLAGNQGEMSQHSGRYASIGAAISLSGILSIFIFLYKTTNLGSILNTLIQNKTKFGKNLSDEEYHETLEDISGSSHSVAYNVLYNTSGDY